MLRLDKRLAAALSQYLSVTDIVTLIESTDIQNEISIRKGVTHANFTTRRCAAVKPSTFKSFVNLEHIYAKKNISSKLVTIPNRLVSFIGPHSNLKGINFPGTFTTLYSHGATGCHFESPPEYFQILYRNDEEECAKYITHLRASGIAVSRNPPMPATRENFPRLRAVLYNNRIMRPVEQGIPLIKFHRCEFRTTDRYSGNPRSYIMASSCCKNSTKLMLGEIGSLDYRVQILTELTWSARKEVPSVDGAPQYDPAIDDDGFEKMETVAKFCLLLRPCTRLRKLNIVRKLTLDQFILILSSIPETVTSLKIRVAPSGSKDEISNAIEEYLPKSIEKLYISTDHHIPFSHAILMQVRKLTVRCSKSVGNTEKYSGYLKSSMSVNHQSYVSLHYEISCHRIW